MYVPDALLWLSPEAQKRFWFASLLTSAVSLLAIKVLDISLVTNAAPSGIISFEFAGSMARAQQILNSWDAEAKIRCGLSLGIDYLFLVAYAVFISISCTYVAKALTKRQLFLANLGYLLAWAQLAAALLDAIENAALIQLLLGSQRELFAWAALWCAWLKFALVGFGLAYMLLGFILVRIFRYRM
jgi:hypothetical protein